MKSPFISVLVMLLTFTPASVLAGDLKAKFLKLQEDVRGLEIEERIEFPGSNSIYTAIVSEEGVGCYPGDESYNTLFFGTYPDNKLSITEFDKYRVMVQLRRGGLVLWSTAEGSWIAPETDEYAEVVKYVLEQSALCFSEVTPE